MQFRENLVNYGMKKLGYLIFKSENYAFGAPYANIQCC